MRLFQPLQSTAFDLQFDAFEVSLLYLYGLSNSYKGYGNGALVFEADDLDASCLEVKAAYQFSEALGVFLSYRSYALSDDFGGDLDFSGCGMGIQYRF